jgi:hypothetical protein
MMGIVEHCGAAHLRAAIVLDSDSKGASERQTFAHVNRIRFFWRKTARGRVIRSLITPVIWGYRNVYRRVSGLQMIHLSVGIAQKCLCSVCGPVTPPSGHPLFMNAQLESKNDLPVRWPNRSASGRAARYSPISVGIPTV